MKIELQKKVIKLVKHAKSAPRHGRRRHRNEAGVDADGRVYFKGRSGRWSVAFQTLGIAEAMLGLRSWKNI